MPQPTEGWTYAAELKRPLPASDESRALRWDAGWSALLEDRLDEAYRLADALARAQPPLSCARSLLGFVELRAGRLAAAEGHFEAAREMTADHCAVVTARAGALLLRLEHGEREAAYDELEALRQIEPRHVLVSRFRDELRAQLADTWLRRGREEATSPAEAAQDLERALRFAPEAAGLHLELARLYREASLLDRALAAAHQAVSLQPRHVDSLAIYAALLDDHGRAEEALDVYRAAAELAPRDSAIAAHRRRLEARARLTMPEKELARIRGSRSLTRADLSAALCGTLHEAMESAPRSAVIVTDVQESWARELILDCLALGLQRAYPGHAFEPRSRVTTAELQGALLRAARWIDRRAPRLERGACGGPVPAASAKALVEEALRDSSRVTGALVLDTARALERIARNCRR